MTPIMKPALDTRRARTLSRAVLSEVTGPSALVQHRVDSPV
ncbi:MAG: hypothetical protein R2729_07225 [Bryobacteraceae bacterium]